MATSSDTGLFQVMEVDEDGGELMIFAEDQQDQSDLSLDIDLTNDNNITNNNNKYIQQQPSRKNVKKKKLKTSRIEVVVRKRPMNSREIDAGETDIGCVYSKESRITICEPRLKVDLTRFTQYHDFKFDHCFDDKSTNKEIYNKCVKPLFNTILKVSGNNKFAGKATCFGYGQTGSGKTYTLLGSMDNKSGKYVEGLYAMAVRDLFKYLPKNNQIIVSFYEIYGGKLFDLLADRKQILCREDGKQKVNIIGLKRIKCENAEFLMNIIMNGNAIRQTGSTGANNTSSRSHAILSMDILPIRGRISFIDLAGSERGADTQNNDKQTRIEGAEINKSLLALKECIRALDQNSIHKPFRGSKLTQVLKESFIGNSRTLMIANISPNSGSCENTLNTLRYAYRVKELKNQNNNNNNNNNNNDDNDKKSLLARNRSEPSLPTFKSLSRPQTARKRNNNKSKNSQNNNNNQRVMNRNNNNNNNKYLSVQNNNKGSLRDHHIRSKSSNNSEYSVKTRENRAKRRKLQQNQSNDNNVKDRNMQQIRKKMKPSPPEPQKPERSQHQQISQQQQQEKLHSSKPSSSQRRNNDNGSNNNHAGNIRRHHYKDRADRHKTVSPPKQDDNNKEENSKIENIDTDIDMNDNQISKFTKKQLIKAHRKHIDEFMILIKEDMQLLKSFDKDEYNNKQYQDKLINVLQRQENAVKQYKSKLFKH